MRCFFLLCLLVFPSAAIADSASAKPDAITSLTQEVQQLRAENEKLSARIKAIEQKFSAGQKVIVIGDHSFGQPPMPSPSLADPNRKP
jgi:hypothetical protein